MTKSHARKGSSRAQAARRPATPDGAVYIVVTMIGVFGIWLWAILVPEADSWKHGLLGYVIAILALINLYSWRVYLGRHVLGWQQSLARLVLRWAGYGTRSGRPLEAAHGSQRARMMLLVGLSASALVIAGLTVLLYAT